MNTAEPNPEPTPAVNKRDAKRKDKGTIGNPEASSIFGGLHEYVVRHQHSWPAWENLSDFLPKEVMPTSSDESEDDEGQSNLTPPPSNNVRTRDVVSPTVDSFTIAAKIGTQRSYHGPTPIASHSPSQRVNKAPFTQSQGAISSEEENSSRDRDGKTRKRGEMSARKRQKTGFR